MTNTETMKSNVADYLYMHEWQREGCKCGWKPTSNPDGDDHADHVAGILVDAFTITYDLT